MSATIESLCCPDCDSRKFFGEDHDGCNCICHIAQVRRCMACPVSHAWDCKTGDEHVNDPAAPELSCPAAVNRVIESAAVTGWLNERERARLRGAEMLDKVWAMFGGADAVVDYGWHLNWAHPTLNGPVPVCRAAGTAEPVPQPQPAAEVA